MQEKIPTRLIIRYLSSEATTEEVEVLLKWVSEDAQNQKIFTEWIKVWEAKPGSRVSFDTVKALSNLNERIDREQSLSFNRQPAFAWKKIAASLIILATASVALFTLWYQYKRVDISYAAYHNASDTIVHLTLADGSRITLNMGATVQYPVEFQGDKREVLLEGEAFFDVKRDTLRPFIVRTGEIQTEVLGTSFNIKSAFAQTIVSVVTGKVKVSDPHSSVLLLPHEKITCSEKKLIGKTNADLDADIAWKYPTLTFQDIRISTVVASIEKYYGVNISLENESIGDCMITGKFSHQPLQKILEAISFSTGVEFKSSGKHYMLLGRGCDNQNDKTF